ncbi:trypsin-2-like [Agrilus planipennis]|uniref:Trypsin-2-like n=1 Tax=Agrilus planipennis TaxID=224129 RepID=A0A1W4WKZ7_AGRPL|nr:trypsin-2-like [Agrilus planipennis]
MKIFLFTTLVSLFVGLWAFPGQIDIAEDEPRIVGGEMVKIEQYPYIAQLYLNDEYWCGASIISPRWVLTVGHCTYMIDVNNLTLRVGATEFNETAYNRIIISNTYLHPSYDDATMDYDISILRLQKDLVFGNKVGSIALPRPNVVLPAGTVATIAGWGNLLYEGGAPIDLHSVNVPIISNADCARSYANSAVFITDRFLCAGEKQGGKDACDGDHGGPLVVNKTLYGLISTGIRCADPNYPGVYTSVSSVRSFITSVTKL